MMLNIQSALGPLLSPLYDLFCRPGRAAATAFGTVRYGRGSQSISSSMGSRDDFL